MTYLYDHFKESGTTDLPYQPNHHLEDIHAIKKVIRTNNSLLVLGLSGSGKSSLLRFLVSNPAAQSKDMLFVYIDCNGVDWSRNTEAIEEEICNRIIGLLLAQWTSVWSPGRAKPVLRFLMEKFSKDDFALSHLVVIFDRSELLQSRLGEAFFYYLRALRDINPRLSYIFSGRDLTREMFSELADIIWNEPHWIGALSLDDAKMIVNRHLTRLGITLEVEAVDKLLVCVGRHPGLLKYTCELIMAGKINLNDNETKVIEQLLMEPLIEYQCRDLWQDLDLTAQNELRRVAQAEKPLSPLVITWLTHCGILIHPENGWLEFTSPVFKGYVNKLGPPPLALEKGIVFKGSEALVLSKEEFDLFKILWDHQPQIVSHDEISEAVWPDAQGGVSQQMITNLVKRLRDKLGDNRYIDSVRGRGYRFIQGTAPLPRNLDIHTSTLQK